MVMRTVSEAAGQPWLPVVVRIRFTKPFAASVLLGAYVQLSVTLFGLNVPFPPVHIPPVAVCTFPFNKKLVWFAQMVISLPALATMGAIAVNVADAVADEHPI